MSKGLGRRGVHMLLITTALLAGAAGIALATIPGTGGVISGCYEKKSGILRVIDAEAGKKCLSFETAISWNQQGQQGLQGSQGPKGEGDPGLTGKDGLNGTNGVDGKDGVSVTSANEPAGAHCAYGGSAITAANAVTYACNGAPGAAGGLPALHYVAADLAARNNSG